MGPRFRNETRRSCRDRLRSKAAVNGTQSMTGMVRLGFVAIIGALAWIVLEPYAATLQAGWDNTFITPRWVPRVLAATVCAGVAAWVARGFGARSKKDK